MSSCPEDRLNRDPAFRRQFLDSPVDVLRKEGLLSPSQESALKEAVTKMRAVPGGADALNRRTIGFTWFLK